MQQTLKIRRCQSNRDRERPNREERHSVYEPGNIDQNSDGPNILYETNLEWLSLNWRKHRAQVISTSFRRIVLSMYEQEFNYFPTLREIRDDLIKGQIQLLEKERHEWTDDTKYNAMKKGYIAMWKMLFRLINLGGLDKPLSVAILSNPYHPITKHLLYMYSMESFIYQSLNRASRLHDDSQIIYYGSYSAALSCILYFANKFSGESLQGTNKVYRGLQLSTYEIEKLRSNLKNHLPIQLTGFQSTSSSQIVAEEFAFKDLAADRNAVLYEIDFTGDEGLLKMLPDFTSYEEEGEVLLQDGLDYDVVDIKMAPVTDPKILAEYDQVLKVHLVHPPKNITNYQN